MVEIDIFLASDDSMPPGIENDDDDSEGDIHYLEKLLSNDSTSLLENKSYNLDHVNDPSPNPPLPLPRTTLLVEFCPRLPILAPEFGTSLPSIDSFDP
ncbi:hypothetical protein Tco_0692018 [Tanacetum coccineum]